MISDALGGTEKEEEVVVVAGHRSQENLQFGLLHLEWGRVFCGEEFSVVTKTVVILIIY